MHNNTFRLIQGTDLAHKRVNNDVLKMFFNAAEEPSKDEGIDDIVHAFFVPQFDNDRAKRIYMSILCEK